MSVRPSLVAGKEVIIVVFLPIRTRQPSPASGPAVIAVSGHSPPRLAELAHSG
jgi:hypothetical protein